MIDGLRGLRRRARGGLSAVAIGLALAGGVSPALAQAIYAFDVPRGDLAEVVVRIARIAGRPIVVPAGLLRGRVAGPIAGQTSVEAALARALAGTGLQVVTGPNSSLAIRPASALPAGVPGADLAAIDVTDGSGIPGGSHNDQGFQQGDAGNTVRIADAPAREIPIAVTAVTQKVIESQVITTTTDALANVAGVTVDTGGNGLGRPNISIRGMSGSANAYNVNGMPTSTYEQIPIDAVERVEVIKGPSSILSGVSGDGGLVNVSLKQPTETEIRSITARYGSFNYKTIATDLGGRLEGLEGTTYRFVASGNHADQNYAGYRDPHEFLVSPTVRWQGEDLMLQAGLRYIHSRIVPETFTTVPELLSNGRAEVVRFPRGTPVGSPFFGGTNETLVLSTKQSYEVGRIFGMDVTLNNSFEYGRYDFKYSLPVVGGPVEEAGSTRPFTQGGAIINNSSVTDRLDLTLKYEAPLFRQTLKFGYDYLNYENNNVNQRGDTFDFDIITGLPRVRSNSGGVSTLLKSTQNTQGVYVIDKFDTLDDRLHILGSVRRDEFVESSSFVVPSIDFQTGSGSKTSGLSWVAGAAFDLAPWMTVYGNRSNGFSPNIGVDLNGRTFAPQGRDLAEVGARYYLFDKRLTVTNSFFDLVMTNVAIADPSDLTGLRKILVGAQRSKGMEIEAQGEILPGLNVIASLTSQTFDAGLDTNSLSYIVGRPKHLQSLWMTYTLQDTPLAGLTFGAGVQHVGRFTLVNNFNNEVYRYNGYDLINAMISYEQPDYTISLRANNLLNKNAFTPGSSATFLLSNQTRNIVLQATYRF